MTLNCKVKYNNRSLTN